MTKSCAVGENNVERGDGRAHELERRECGAKGGALRRADAGVRLRQVSEADALAETRRLRLGSEQNVLVLTLFLICGSFLAILISRPSKMSLISRTSRTLPSHSRALIIASTCASSSAAAPSTALQHRRTLATPTGPTKPYHHEKPPPPPPTWLTVQLRKNPLAMKLFLNMMSIFGYGSQKQIAARRALNIYDQHCSGKAEEEKEFWRDGEFFSWAGELLYSGSQVCACEVGCAEKYELPLLPVVGMLRSQVSEARSIVLGHG